MPPDVPPQPRASDAATMAAAVRVLSEETPRKGLVRLLPFLGPAFIASIAYVDPGNFATNIQGGAQFGYTLLWVIVGSNLMAMLVQALSAKLGIATGHNLAELCRLHVPAPATWFLWGLMEIVAMATDLAEFLGAAIGFNLLFGIPLWVAAILTAVATFGVLSLEHKGFRPLEAVITALVGVIAVCYLIETVLDRPDWGQVAFHSVVPQFRGRESLILAAGILGATVMPHVIFLHSALLQGRVVVRDPVRLRRLFRFETTDVILAGFDPTRTLVISQVVLSFGLPFAVVPLILFTRRKDIMGVLVNRPSTTALASLVAALIVALNLYLLYHTLRGGS